MLTTGIHEAKSLTQRHLYTVSSFNTASCMIKLLAGKYKDQLAMHPRAQLTASKKSECYLEVAALLKSIT